MNIIFIGPRGVGKSKVSRKLSKLCGMSVISTDMIACYELGGKTIPTYIEECKGDWRPFRDLEFHILERLISANNIIVDCGGGIIFDVNENGKEILSTRKIDLLRKIGKIIALNQKISYLKEKVKEDSSRPNLSNTESYEQILQRRIPLYNSVADIQLHIDDMETEEVAKWVYKDYLK